jgi:hypothetical protein
MEKKPFDYEYRLMYMGLNNEQVPDYPRWLYREDTAPILVESTAAEIEARSKGFDNISAAAMSNRNLINWFWDLEDFSVKQLIVLAKDEFDVDLPIEANQEVLFKAVCELTRHAPQNRNRLILMAHTIEMNYDATLEEIKRMASGAGQHLETETEVSEFWA